MTPGASVAPPSPTPVVHAQQPAGAMPEPRQEVASATAGGRVYVVGGFDPQRRSSASVFVFGDGGWTRGPDYPLPVDHAAAAAVGGALYVAGGYSNGPATARVFRFDGGWHEFAPLHHARGALALVAAGGRLYAIGGAAAGREVAAVEAYDASANAWSDVAALPLPRDHVAGFAYQGKACVAGGRSPNTARVDCYDATANAWSRLPDLPTPTSGAGASADLGYPVVAGGEDAAEGKLVDRVAYFADGGWTEVSMTAPRHGIELAPWNGWLLACGGADAPGYAAVSSCMEIR